MKNTISLLKLTAQYIVLAWLYMLVQWISEGTANEPSPFAFGLIGAMSVWLRLNKENPYGQE